MRREHVLNNNVIGNEAELLANLDMLFKNREFEVALNSIVEFEKNQNSIDVEVSRFKARILSILGEGKKSLEILEQYVHESKDLADWHLVSELMIEQGRFREAKECLSKTIDLSLEIENEYFLQTCYLERAYVKILLKEFTSANLDLDQVDESENVFWLKGVESISKSRLLSKIQQHK